MSEPFCIYIDRLKGDEVQKIDLTLPPDFFEVNEPGIGLNAPVKVSGQAYLTDDDLVLHLTASTVMQMPCAICNKMVPITLAIKDFYHAEPLSNIRTAVFDLRSVLREALLVELPNHAECQGKCPERASIEAYLHKEEKDSEHYFPFSDLTKP